MSRFAAKPLNIKYKKFAHMFSALSVGLLAITVAAPQTTADRFVNEFGESTVLDGQNVIAVGAVGAVVSRFYFQSHLIDDSTGAYIIPDYSLAYTIEEEGANTAGYIANGLIWVFGGSAHSPDPEIVSFDPVTGQGEAKAFLPLNLVTRSYTWGKQPDGTTILTYYWGVGDEVDHDGLHPPVATARGSKTVTIDSDLSEITLAFVDNHALEIDKTSTMVLVAKSSTMSDRVFDLAVSSPGALDMPASVTLPANAFEVEVSVTPRQLGLHWVYASSGSFPGVLFRSQKAEVFQAIVATEGGGEVGQGLATPDLRQYCVHAAAGTPDGGPDPGPGGEVTRCGACRKAGNPDDPCPGLNGDVVGFYKPYQCPYSEFSSCYERQGVITLSLTKWEKLDEYTERCEAANLWEKIHHVLWYGKRWRTCCTYRRVDGEFTVQVKDCV